MHCRFFLRAASCRGGGTRDAVDEATKLPLPWAAARPGTSRRITVDMPFCTRRRPLVAAAAAGLAAALRGRRATAEQPASAARRRGSRRMAQRRGSSTITKCAAVDVFTGASRGGAHSTTRSRVHVVARNGALR